MSAKKPRTNLRIIESLEPVDRLSNLPKDLLCHILSLVPTLDAVRTCVLSRQWRRMWYSVPVFDFDEQCSLKKFCTFVKNCLRLRKNDMVSVGNTPISKFRLAIRPSWKILDKWLKMVGESNNIKDLDLEFYAPEGSRVTYYHRVSEKTLPARSLTSLRLSNADVTGLLSIGFRKLKSLSLVGVKFDDQVLHGLLSGCSSLEKLVLVCCTGLSRPKFSSLSLKFLEIDSTPAPQTVHVAAKNLESFAFSGSQIPYLAPQGNLKTLSFSHAVLTEKQLADLISRLPCLESLTLKHCKSERFKIQSQLLRHLIFSVDERSCCGLKVDINTPNLVHFSFKGSPMVNLSLQAQNISEATVEFFETEYDFDWFSRLIQFLPQFGSSTSLNLHVQSEEALIFPDEMRIDSTAPLCNVKDLKVVVHKQLMRKDLAESISWLASKED